jgi:hypothetical protein
MTNINEGFEDHEFYFSKSGDEWQTDDNLHYNACEQIGEEIKRFLAE